MKRILIFALILLTGLAGFSQDVVNQTDEEGRKQGKWEKQYENGNTRYVGQFQDDMPLGIFFYYYETGEKSSEITYLPDGNAQARFFHNNGAIMGEGPYMNQKKQGEWKFFDDQAILSAVEYYVDGVLQGPAQVFYINGAVSADFSYKDGRKNGPFKEYFSDGKVKREGTYQDDTYDGEYIQYYEDGLVLRKGQYKAAVKHGQWIYYHTDGTIAGQRVYQKGKILKEKFEDGFEPLEEKIDLDEEDILDEDELMEQFMQGGGR